MVKDLKKVEELLKEAERKYRQLVENQEDFICCWQPDSTLTFANQSYCKFFGKTHDQLMGLKWLSLIPEDAQDDITQYYQDLARNPRVNRIEHKAISSDGKPYWQEWIDTPIFDSQGRLHEFQSIGRDITERRQLEERVRNHSELFNKILNTTSEAYWFGKADRLMDVNENACTMLGYTREEMLNMPISNIDVVDTEEDVKRRVGEILETSCGLFETQHRRKDGSIIDVEVRVVIWVSEGMPYLVSFIRDITDLKKSLGYKKELELIKTSNRIKSEILGLFRHDLLTPMNAILGFSRMLSDDPELASQHREKAEIVKQGASRLVRTLNSIISMADIDARVLEIDNEAFDLFELLEEVEQFFRPLYKAKELGMRVELDPRTPWSVIGDRPKLRQVLENLLENSLRFTDQGEVSLRVWKEEAADEVLDDITPVRIMFEVEDSGVGIEKERQNKLFDLVFPMDQTRKQDGLGLGLPISREFVRMMGGNIEVESQPGRGSRFCFDVTLQSMVGDKLGDKEREPCMRRIERFAQPEYDFSQTELEVEAVLSEVLRAQLRQSVEEGDMGLFSELLEQVGQSQPDTVKGLRRLADAFDYRRLNALLGKKGAPNEE